MPKSLAHAPRTLWALVGFSVARTVVSLALGSVRTEAFVVGGIISLVLLCFLLGGSRFVWWLLVAGIALGFRAGRAWLDVPFSLVEIGLLLAPQTRRYVFRPRPRRLQRSANRDVASPAVPAGTGTPSGWYPDPDRPGWMRYWQSEDETWLGSTKAPRRMRRQVPPT